MKKLIIMLLALVVTLGIAGCSDNNDEPDPHSDEEEVMEATIAGSVWQNGDEYTGFAYNNTFTVYDNNGYELIKGTYDWDGQTGTLYYDNGDVYTMGVFEDDPLLSESLAVEDPEGGVFKYLFCEEVPDFMKGGEENPAPNQGNGQGEIPESMRPTFMGGKDVTESRIGENRGLYLANLGETTWMIGDDVYTFFSDGFVDVYNELMGSQALGTYNVEENGDVLCLMDNGAEVLMNYAGETTLTLNGKEMHEVAYDIDREAPHVYSGPGSVIGGTWYDFNTDEEFCFLANDVFMLYYPDTSAVVVGEHHWNDDGTGTVKVDGNTYKVKLENGYLYEETPNGYEPLRPVHPEKMSAEAQGMERVLVGNWVWTENPDVALDCILPGISNTYDNENGYGTIWAEVFTYDGETVTMEWPENDGDFHGTVTGQILGDGSLALDGWDGWFVRQN